MAYQIQGRGLLQRRDIRGHKRATTEAKPGDGATPGGQNRRKAVEISEIRTKTGRHGNGLLQERVT